MFSFRGDAHKIYLRVKESPSKIRNIGFIKETEEIKSFYETQDSTTLKLIYYRMIKEKNGSGIIPIFATAIPWLLFLFSSHLQDFLFKEGSINWIIFSFIYLTLLTFSLILHFREQAWANFHIQIIQDILEERDSSYSKQKGSIEQQSK
ncbi:hypothetical protein SAMN05216389_104243 [Oceanobacillus limi]|uniref:Uncharacterized protein n=1 Tax=Oceanobacillus limi TaxID=930131 RepID=A0A1I0BA54_9BACI|nr:hypothetical protein [Oceanobacillus limi]SET03304.1 hypothetical protein SAMN05216389_104243 [Oceanobacillus limi]